MIIIIISFFLGALVLLLVEIFVFQLWVSPNDTAITPTATPGLTFEHISKVLHNLNNNITDGPNHIGRETACFINILFSFLFQEMKDDAKVRAIVLSKINQEIAEVLMSKLKSKVIKSLKIHNFSTGTSPPVFSNIHVMKIRMCKTTQTLKKLHISVDISYRGCGKLAIQASTILGKNVYISVEVTHLIGKMILVFNRHPQTHWGLCFESPPDINFNVVSSFAQRSLPKLTKVVSSILRRVIHKKHTKPNYHKRYSPFFKEPLKPVSQDALFFVNDQPLNKGKLIVKLISANRVPYCSSKNVSVYCTVSLGQKPWDAECCPIRQNIMFDTTLTGIEDGIGMSFKGENEFGAVTNGVVVDDVNKYSPAHLNVKPGDLVTAVNNKRVMNFKSALNASLSATKKVRLSISRPIIRWNNVLTSGDAFQDMSSFHKEQENKSEALFVEEEEFLVLKQFLESETKGEPENTFINDVDGNIKSKFCINQSAKLLKSSSCSMNIALFWDEYFLFNLKNTHKYLSVCLWYDDEQQNAQLLGYNNLNIADITLNCISTTSNTYNDSILLNPPQSLGWQEDSILQRPTSVPPLAGKLNSIAGEIKVQFLYIAEKTTCHEHVYVPSQLQDRHVCYRCANKIVHHTAYICLQCCVTLHESCLHGVSTTSPERNVTKNVERPRNDVKGRRHTADLASLKSLKRQRSQTVHTVKRISSTNDQSDSKFQRMPSFSFLKGSEKKAAVLHKKVRELDATLAEKNNKRKELLISKSKYLSSYVPSNITEELSDVEKSIKELNYRRDQI